MGNTNFIYNFANWKVTIESGWDDSPVIVQICANQYGFPKYICRFSPHFHAVGFDGRQDETRFGIVYIRGIDVMCRNLITQRCILMILQQRNDNRGIAL
ncbi:MAG: hypothetical protein SPJ35_00710, partial [Bacteroidaceae bacterium]|nr:hypothetical protein [Bacteroidaceae bacterium]